MTVGYDNIFPIPDADQYSCQIYKYELGHSGLYLNVSNHRDPPFYLYFAGVRYFSGPPSWQSVDFQQVEKPEKHIEVLRGIDLFTRWPDEALLNSKLEVYYVGGSNLRLITIIALAVQRIESVAALDKLVDRQQRWQLAKMVHFQYEGFSIPHTGNSPFEWLQNKPLIQSFIHHWELVRDYYKDHPDGIIDSLVVYTYLNFMNDLERVIRDTSMESEVTAYAESVQLKIKAVMDDILYEATKNADNAYKYL